MDNKEAIIQETIKLIEEKRRAFRMKLQCVKYAKEPALA